MEGFVIDLTLLAEFLFHGYSVPVNQDDRGLYFTFDCGGGAVDCQIALTTNEEDEDEDEDVEDAIANYCKFEISPDLLLIQLWFMRSPGEPFTLGKLSRQDALQLNTINNGLHWSKLDLLKEEEFVSPVLQRVELIYPTEESQENDFARIRQVLGNMTREAEKNFLSVMALATRQRQWYGHEFLESPAPTLSVQ